MIQGDSTLTEETVARARESERALLGAIFVGGDGTLDKALAIIHPDDLFSPPHRLILLSMIRLRDSGQPPDPVLVKGELEQRGDLEAAGGPAVIPALLDGGWVSANIEAYAHAVKEASGKRTRQEELYEEQKALGPQPAHSPLCQHS